MVTFVWVFFHTTFLPSLPSSPFTSYNVHVSLSCLSLPFDLFHLPSRSALLLHPVLWLSEPKETKQNSPFAADTQCLKCSRILMIHQAYSAICQVGLTLIHLPPSDLTKLTYCLPCPETYFCQQGCYMPSWLYLHIPSSDSDADLFQTTIICLMSHCIWLPLKINNVVPIFKAHRLLCC